MNQIITTKGVTQIYLTVYNHSLDVYFKYLFFERKWWTDDDDLELMPVAELRRLIKAHRKTAHRVSASNNLRRTSTSFDCAGMVA